MGKLFWVASLLLLLRPSVAMLSEVTVTVIDTHDDPTKVEFSTGTAMDQLTNLRKSELNCLYSSGINKNSFESCFGVHYSALNDAFLKFISTYRENLVSSFRADLSSVCPQSSDPCDDLVGFLEDRIMADPDIMDDLPRIADQKKDYQSVDSEQLDQAMARFKNRYVVYKNIRLCTAKTVIDTVNAIQAYIKASVRTAELPTDFDYQDFDPNTVFQSLGLGDINMISSGSTIMTSDSDQIVTQSIFNAGSLNGADDRKRKLTKQLRRLVQPLSKKQLTDRSLDSYNFLKGLLGEAQEQKVLNYYVTNGLVDSTQLDLSQLPSATLNLIRKNRLKLNANRVRR